jgi:hypothetical protein
VQMLEPRRTQRYTKETRLLNRTVGRPRPHWQSSERRLEIVFHAELHGTRAMRIHGVQEGIPGEATRVSRGVVQRAVARDRVAAGVALVGIVDAELSVVENIEGLGAKLKIAAFRDFEMFQESDVKVQPARVVHKVASGISKRKTYRGTECCRIG